MEVLVVDVARGCVHCLDGSGFEEHRQLVAYGEPCVVRNRYQRPLCSERLLPVLDISLAVFIRNQVVTLLVLEEHAGAVPHDVLLEHTFRLDVFRAAIAVYECHIALVDGLELLARRVERNRRNHIIKFCRLRRDDPHSERPGHAVTHAASAHDHAYAYHGCDLGEYPTHRAHLLND